MYNQSGNLFYEGYLENGNRRERGTEYDEQGNVIFVGLHDKSNKFSMYHFREMGE